MKKKKSSYQILNSELKKVLNENIQLSKIINNKFSNENGNQVLWTNGIPVRQAPLTKDLSQSDNLPAEIRKKNVNKEKPSHISETIPQLQTLYRISQDIASWRAAVQRSEVISSPQRIDLYRLYKDIVLDSHLSSLIDNRKASILSCDFIVTKDGIEQKELRDLFSNKWFFDFVDKSLDSLFYGFELIEFGNLYNDGKFPEFDYVNTINREYVKPEFGIVGHTFSDITGPSFYDEPFCYTSIGVGNPFNLGLLMKAAPIVIWKKLAIVAYAEYTQMNMPIRVMKSGAYDSETKADAENFLRNMALSTYAVIGLDESIEFAEPRSNQGVSDMFNGLINTMNSELSKLVLGGTAMSDEKSFASSAKLHQTNFLTISRQDEKFIENVLNYQLKPFLIKTEEFDFLEGCKIEVKPNEKLDLIDNFNIDVKLLDYYEIAPEYFVEKYGTPVEKMAAGKIAPASTNKPETPIEKNPVVTADDLSKNNAAKSQINNKKNMREESRMLRLEKIYNKHPNIKHPSEKTKEK